MAFFACRYILRLQKHLGLPGDPQHQKQLPASLPEREMTPSPGRQTVQRNISSKEGGTSYPSLVPTWGEQSILCHLKLLESCLLTIYNFNWHFFHVQKNSKQLQRQEQLQLQPRAKESYFRSWEGGQRFGFQGVSEQLRFWKLLCGFVPEQQLGLVPEQLLQSWVFPSNEAQFHPSSCPAGHHHLWYVGRLSYSMHVEEHSWPGGVSVLQQVLVLQLVSL